MKMTGKYLKSLFFAFFLLSTHLLQAYSIVYVHIGSSLPTHLPFTIAQARLFNKECSIYVIANQSAIQKDSSLFDSSRVSFVSCESLTPSATHVNFHNNRNHDWALKGFWVYTSERFFYLEEFVRQYQLTDVFHFENDIMLYVNLDELLPIFQTHYNGMIGATFENDNRCVPGILYISDPVPLTSLIDYFPPCVDMSKTDMETIAKFKDEQRELIDYLPIVVPEYAFDHPLEALSPFEASPKKAKDPSLFSNYFAEFNSIFDGAAWGVYLGGMDSTFHQDSAPGKIDVYCVFNPSYFSFEWKIDIEGRRIPYSTYQGHEVRINNLHITNKPKIPSFSSLGGITL